jgi:hypothetical protein
MSALFTFFVPEQWNLYHDQEIPMYTCTEWNLITLIFFPFRLRVWNLQYPDIHKMLKFGFGYQTVNDLYPNWILRKFQTLNPSLSSYNVHFCVLMNCLVVDNLTVESPVVIAICNSKSYWMGQGIILMVLTSIQKWDTAFSGGILNFESWYRSWILKIY